jgi:hypothetical protein
MSGGNNDLCTTGTSGSVQTQIFGVSTGGTVRDENCERLKLSKTLYDMGKIGAEAKDLWAANPTRIPEEIKAKDDDTYKKIGIGSLLGVVAYKLFGLH